MTCDEFLRSVLDKHRLPSGFASRRSEICKQIEPVARGWKRDHILELKLSGSLAKGTAIAGSPDLDLFISLDHNTSGTLEEIYDSLFAYLYACNCNPQKRNAAIKIYKNGINVDLIPGKKRTGHTNYHSIWLNRQKTWTQTNIDAQINHVRQSSRINEIKLTKIWRDIHKLDFPSFYLELTVIDALYNKISGDLANNFHAVLMHIRDNLRTSRVEDPSNSNNVVSADLSISEKQTIVGVATSSLSKQYWNQIVW